LDDIEALFLGGVEISNVFFWHSKELNLVYVEVFLQQFHVNFEEFHFVDFGGGGSGVDFRVILTLPAFFLSVVEYASLHKDEVVLGEDEFVVRV